MAGSENIKLLLIARNTPSSLRLLQQLTSCCFDVIMEDCTDSSLNLIKSHSPELILLDSCIHKLQDTDLLSLLKERQIMDTAPVIVLSGSSNIETKLFAFDNGAVDYLAKPFDFRELVSRINIHIKANKTILELKKRALMLEQLSITDPVTGLYNKRYILDRLHSEVSHSMRYNEPISFIMLDVDYFKQINDKYGHLAGDDLLKDLADIIKNCIRIADIAARYGGEEFLIVCPNTDIIGAKILGERIRVSVHNTKFYIKGHSVKISLSIGIRDKQLEPDMDTEAVILKLIEEADIALYKAKFRGRNRVEIFTDVNIS